MTEPRPGESYRSIAVPVAGGELHVGMWRPEEDTAPTVVLVHGVTASHLAWQWVAAELPGVRVIAPDLRGRGRSNSVTGPAGMAAHADDLALVLSHIGVSRAVVVGHSMGAFVAVAFAERYGERVQRLLLVDGGLPLDTPRELPIDQLVASILGPTAARLSMRFDDVEAYLQFWRGHPAFAAAPLSPQLERYFAYDLVPDGERFRPATSYDVTAEDTRDLTAGAPSRAGGSAIDRPAQLITVARGLQNEEPGLYAPDYLHGLLREYPNVVHERWDDLNHYTVIMSAQGGARVARLIRVALDSSRII